MCAVKQHCGSNRRAQEAHQSPLFHTIISLGTPFFYSVGLHRPHLLSTLRGLQNKAGKSAVSVKDGKSPWGDDRGTKKWRKERGGKKERVRQ